jgi:NADH-quinone oxidoreductase subunit M
VAWTELRARYGARSVARLFALYHVPSVLLFVAAVFLEQSGWLAYSAMAGIAAIGIREAVVPGHSWFPRFVEESPMGLVVAFIAPQLGVYAHVQLLAEGLPDTMAQTVAIFGAFTALGAAALGVVQKSPRRALAYLMMSQTGLVAFGIESPSEVAFAGSLLTWQVLAVATSSFAMTVSALEARRGPLSLVEYSGCFSRTPRMAAGFLVMGLASVGFPMTLGFIAEDLLVQGSVEATPALAFVLIGATALNGMNVMRAFFRLFSGQRAHGGEQDLTPRESWALSVVLIVLLLGGTAPSLITSRAFEFVPKHRTEPHAEAPLAQPGAPAGSFPDAPFRAVLGRS